MKGPNCKSAPVENEHVSNPQRRGMGNGELRSVQLLGLPPGTTTNPISVAIPREFLFPLALGAAAFIRELWHNFWHFDEQCKKAEENIEKEKG